MTRHGQDRSVQRRRARWTPSRCVPPPALAGSERRGVVPMRLRARLRSAVVLFVLASVAGCFETESAPPAPRHVVFVLLDTLRADHVGAYGYYRDTTPAIDANQFTFTVPAGATRLESVPRNDMGAFLVEGAQ